MNEEFKYMIIAIAIGVIICVGSQKYSDHLRRHNESKQQLEQIINDN
jgi:hypothetical protein